MAGALPVRYRPTTGQAVGRAIWIGVVAAATAGAPAVLLSVAGESWAPAAAIPAAFALGAALTFPLARRGGVDLDTSGIRPSLPGPAGRRLAAWQSIVDIRAERRGARAVPVVYLKSGASWRLRAPYSGKLLGRDPHFDDKLATMRNLWETCRTWKPIVAKPGDSGTD